MQTLTLALRYPLYRLFEAGAIDPDQFNARVRRFANQVQQLEDRTAVESKRLLKALDRDIRDGVLRSSDSDQLSRSNINSVIDQAVDKFVDSHARVMAQANQRATDLGGAFQQNINRLTGQSASVAPVPASLTGDMTEVQQAKNDALGEDLRAKLKLEVAQGVADGKTPHQIISDMVSKRIVTPERPDGDPSARGALARVEAMSRDNVRQVFNATTFSQSKAKKIPGMLKAWVHNDSDAPRETHIEAEEKYGVGGTTGPIPVGQNFVIDGEKLMFPHDPKASPKNTRNCKCISVEIVPDLADRLETGEEEE